MFGFDSEDNIIDLDDIEQEEDFALDDDLQESLDLDEDVHYDDSEDLEGWLDDDSDPEDDFDLDEQDSFEDEEDNLDLDEQDDFDDGEDDFDEEIEDFFDEEDDLDDDPVLGPHQGKDEDDSDDDDPILGPHQGKDEDDSDDEPILGPHQGKDEDFDSDDDEDDLDFDLDEWLDNFQDDEEDELEAFDEPMIGPHQGNCGGAPNYENFDFDNDGLKTVVGDIAEDMDNWHEQEGNTCAVCAQEFVLEALTGREFDMDELRELAEDNGWYDDGTPLWDVGNLLEHYGLQVEKFTGGTCEDIQDCLNAGGKVIVSVDSDEVWFGNNDDLFFPGSDADHAVQVIGFDYSNPSEPMVILNDSGVANGCGAMISLENFQEAWEDGDCFMVTAYA